MLSLRRDDVTTTRTVVRITNFNPRLREGGDDIYHAPSCCKKISIHASAKEATTVPLALSFALIISIHASAKEATKTKEYYIDILEISIHASAKEATLYTDNISCQFSFQSTPPRRRRQRICSSVLHIADFNPRLREGGDPEWKGRLLLDYNFNPRLREGGDDAAGMVCKAAVDFNPRLREGGDKMEKFLWRDY